MSTPSAKSRPGRLPKLTVETVVRRMTEISALPEVALKVIEVARDPDAGAADLKDVVEGDPSLSARVLRIVNSASFGVRTTVTNLHQAISLLGFGQIRNLALTASVSELFKEQESLGTYSRAMLWRHLVSVAICARLTARRCGLAAFEEAFLAGLLHDIGIIVEDQNAHLNFAGMINDLTDNQTLRTFERDCIGFDHCQLGEAVAEAWRFPPVVRAAIRHHHASHQFSGEGSEIVRCVEIANAICSIKGMSSVGMNLVEPPLKAFQAAGFGRDDIVILASDLDKEIKSSGSLFEL